jgi:hypothetical protein
MERKHMRTKDKSTAGQNFSCKYKTILATCWSFKEDPWVLSSSVNRGINNPDPTTARANKT